MEAIADMSKFFVTLLKKSDQLEKTLQTKIAGLGRYLS